MTNFKKTLSLLLFFTLFVLSHRNSLARQIIFEENFSSGFEKWNFVRNSNEMWSIENGLAQAYVNRNNTITEITPKDEYWGSNWCNTEFGLDFTPMLGADRNISFGFIDLNNWYEIHFVSSFFEFAKLKSGTVHWSKRQNYILQNNKTYKIKILFNNGKIDIYIDNEKIFDDFDETFLRNNCGKISLKAGTGVVFPTKVFFDNIVVYDLDAPDIKEAPLIKQNDPSWAEIEYDSANQWSTRPTIARWGCALTSMVMILKSHAISVMPGGEVVSPATLNQWLKQQPDGYLGNGLLNWLAVSRLTKQLSGVLSTPVLEYKKLNYSTGWLQDIISQIGGQKPVILELPGHFLVADNYTADKTDLLIKDPAYNFDKLSQHNQAPQSIRTFTPSQTDLSYILLAVDSAIEVQIEKPGGATQSADLDEYLTTTEENPEEKEQSPKLKIISLAKPELGEYLLKFSQQNLGPLKFTLFTYDKNGEVKDLSKQTYVGQTPIVYKLQFTQSTADQITRESDFDTFRALVTELSKANQIQSSVAEIWLDYFAQIAQQNDILQDKLRYIDLLAETAKWYKNDLTVLAQESLQEELINIKINLERL